MKILCCLCGTSIDPNDAAMCIECLRQQFDLSVIINPTNEIIACKKCDRWQTTKDHWQHHDVESAGLLSACLKKISAINNGKAKLLEACWIWTEPHCKRLKIKLDFEAGILDDKVKLRQKAVVEFVIKNKQCLDCIREATDHSWGAMIQVRQRVGHKHSLFMLEHVLTQANMHRLMLNVSVAREGLDMYFKHRNEAERTVQVIQKNMPVKVKLSKKLVSQDKHSNTSKYELTYIVEVAPLCKGDLVITPKEVGGGAADLMIITKLSSSVHLTSPCTCQRVEVNASKLFSLPTHPLTVLLTRKHLVTFVVLDINLISTPAMKGGRETGGGGKMWSLAEAEVAREADLGLNDETYLRVLTHLGHILQPGDLVLGYDLTRAVLTQEDEERINALPFSLPDIVLIKKIHSDKKVPKQSSKLKGRKPGRKKGEKEEQTQKDQGSGKGKKKEKMSRVKKNSGDGGDEEEEEEEEEVGELDHMVDTMTEEEGLGGVKNASESGSRRHGPSRSHRAFGEYDDDDEREFEEFLLDIHEEEDEEEEDDGDDDGEEEEGHFIDDDDDDIDIETKITGEGEGEGMVMKPAEGQEDGVAQVEYRPVESTSSVR